MTCPKFSATSSLPGEHLISAATFHARVRILHVMRAYRFSAVSSRPSSFQVFSHGSHFPLHVANFALLIRAAAPLTGGVRAKFCPVAGPGRGASMGACW